MKIGYIKPTFPGEKRVGLLPKHLEYCSKEDERRFEKGYGASLGITDRDYSGAGGYERESLFEWADVIYCIKVPQLEHYDSFREGQGLVGWIHPMGASGKHFMENCAAAKNLWLFDITNCISLRYHNGSVETLNVPRDITRKNSILAGYASTMHGIMLRGGVSQGELVVVFGSGNVALGALKYLASLGIDPLLRRRSNVLLLQAEFETYDIFINTQDLRKDTICRVRNAHQTLDVGIDPTICVSPEYGRNCQR